MVYRAEGGEERRRGMDTKKKTTRIWDTLERDRGRTGGNKKWVFFFFFFLFVSILPLYRPSADCKIPVAIKPFLKRKLKVIRSQGKHETVPSFYLILSFLPALGYFDFMGPMVDTCFGINATLTREGGERWSSSIVRTMCLGHRC